MVGVGEVTFGDIAKSFRKGDCGDDFPELLIRLTLEIPWEGEDGIVEDFLGFLWREVDAAGTGLSPDAMAKGIEGADGSGGEKGLPHSFRDAGVEGETENWATNGGLDHLQHGGFAGAGNGRDH